jgi:GntR family transcriptional regulator, histidine utilization repressor
VAEPARRAPLARYERVKRHILDGIRKGRWNEGDRLPSEHELRDTLGVARMTVNRALRELADSGQVRRVQGAGSFVARPPRRSPLIEIRDIADDIAARGHRHEVRVLEHGRVRANAALATAFRLRAGATLFHSLLLHLEDGQPLQIEERHVAPSFAPRYLEQDFTRATPAHYLRSIAPATEVEHTVDAVLPDLRTARLLALQRGEPCLRLTRQTWVGTQPATRGVFIYPGARYSLGSRYTLHANRGAP